MRPRLPPSREAIAHIAEEFMELSRSLLDEDSGRARGYAEAAMMLAYTFDVQPAAPDTQCAARGGSFWRWAGRCRPSAPERLRGALGALRRVLSPGGTKR